MNEAKATEAGIADVVQDMSDRLMWRDRFSARDTPPGTVMTPLASQGTARRGAHFGRRHRLSEADHDHLIVAHMAALAGRNGIVAMTGAKGGMGTTLMTLLAGLVLAETAGARPVVIELTPDWGSVAPLLGHTGARTAADLLAHQTAAHHAGIGFMQQFMVQWGRLPILAAPSDPMQARSLAPDDYAAVLRLLGANYNVLLLDCGAPLTHPITAWALRTAHHAVLFTHPDGPALRHAWVAAAHLSREQICSRTDFTLVINGVATPTIRGLTEPAWKEVMSHLNAFVTVPQSEPLQRRFTAGTLAVETIPDEMRRAIKAMLVAILGRLAYG